MSRDDGLLYTGITSSRARTNPVRKAIKDKKDEQRTKLTPSQEVIAEAIAGEKRLVTEQLLRLPIDLKSTDEDVKSVLLAYQMHLSFIDRFQNRINNIMRQQ